MEPNSFLYYERTSNPLEMSRIVLGLFRSFDGNSDERNSDIENISAVGELAIRIEVRPGRVDAVMRNLANLSPFNGFELNEQLSTIHRQRA